MPSIPARKVVSFGSLPRLSDLRPARAPGKRTEVRGAPPPVRAEGGALDALQARVAALEARVAALERETRPRPPHIPIPTAPAAPREPPRGLRVTCCGAPLRGEPHVSGKMHTFKCPKCGRMAATPV